MEDTLGLEMVNQFAIDTYGFNKKAILNDFTTSYRLQKAIADFDNADPIDALQDARRLVRLMQDRVNDLN